MVYELPSLPFTIVCVELAAVTVKVDEPPGASDAGVAVMLTVGAGWELTVTMADAEVCPPGPVARAV
jgi:hypothetical protein